jgi:hypothetical protein
MGLVAEQASARSANCGARPKTCPAALPRTSRTFPRTPLPSTIDPISKEVKYGDPNHRDCERSFRPATAYLPREKHSKYNDKTHTSVRTIRFTSGAIWAVSPLCMLSCSDNFSFTSTHGSCMFSGGIILQLQSCWF